MHDIVSSSMYPDRMLSYRELLIAFRFQGPSSAPEHPFVKTMRLAVGGS